MHFVAVQDLQNDVSKEYKWRVKENGLTVRLKEWLLETSSCNFLGSNRILTWLQLGKNVLTDLILSCLILPFLILFYLILSYQFLSYPILS